MIKKEPDDMESAAWIEWANAAIAELQERCEQHERTGKDLVDQVEKLEAAREVMKQTLLEITHAQQCGPGWYTRGASGLHQQVRMWINKANVAIKKTESNNHES